MEKLISCESVDHFKQWVTERLTKSDCSPSALALSSYYVFSFDGWDREERRFVRLRAVAEQTRGLFFQKEN